MARLPQAWLDADKPKPQVAKTSVKARVDMSDEVAGQGLCPDCRSPMTAAFAGEIPTLTCVPCRISLPTPDSGDIKDMSELDLTPYRF